MHCTVLQGFRVLQGVYRSWDVPASGLILFCLCKGQNVLMIKISPYFYGLMFPWVVPRSTAGSMCRIILLPAVLKTEQAAVLRV